MLERVKKIVHQLLSRRALLRRFAVALSVGPIVELSSALAHAEKRARHHRGPRPGEFWIGHC
jgi:hypothetical protein